MFLTGFFFLLLLSGGIPDFPPEHLEEKYDDKTDEITPSYNQPIHLDGKPSHNQGMKETSGRGTETAFDDQRDFEGGYGSSSVFYSSEQTQKEAVVPNYLKHPTSYLRGIYEGDRPDDTYHLDMDNPPEYLKEYFASFKDRPEMGKSYCNYQEISDMLDLKSDNHLFTMSRPVTTHRSLTYIYLEMVVSAILDVKETDQTFTSHIWLYMSWDNKFIRWHPEEYCGIKHIIVPANLLWKPDIIIQEMIERDKSPPSPYLKINSFGEIEYRNDMVVVSNCKMDVYKFPFDIQKCNISFKSLMHSDTEFRFVINQNTTMITKWARLVMQTQYEWLFLGMTVTNTSNVRYFGLNQTTVVYTIYMQRRSVLYVVNFLLPLFFFLCLDLASFLIPDGGGEKIGFKLTVLLAVTVMQLIFNEILPCSSDKIPLIAVYCIGIFSLMLLSLLETILTVHLIEKDSITKANDTDGDQILSKQDRVSSDSFSEELKKCSDCSSLCGVTADQMSSETKKNNCRYQTGATLSVGKVSDILKMMDAPTDLWQETKKLGYWTGVAKELNKGFFILYVITVVVFFVYIISIWTSPFKDQF